MDWIKKTVDKLTGGAARDNQELRDRRRYLRAPCVERVMCVISEEAISVLVSELSLMGMRVRIPRKVEVDDLLTFRAHREVKKTPAPGAVPPPLPRPLGNPAGINAGVPGADPTVKRDLSKWGVTGITGTAEPAEPPKDDTETEAVPFKARVVWVRRHLQTSEYDVGLAFSEIVNHERDRWTRGVLRDSGVRESVSQRRENIRVRADLPLQYRTPTGYEGSGTVLDLSMRGLQANVKMELARDTVITMLISTGVSGTSVQNLKGRVLRCKKTESGEWNIGVSLDDLSARDKKGVQRCLEYLMKREAGEA